ncbi:MAG: DMT family transporter [Actinomycetota bacterium]|nr:DMT family transporter [Actinomycetota bacterium]
MHPDVFELVPPHLVGSNPPLGIAIALLGGLFLALGAQFQHRGVTVVEERFGSGHKAGLNLGQILRLLKSPWWVLGTLLLGLAILCQLTSLGFAPIIVVQPLGVVALVITSVVNARVSHSPLTRQAIRAITFCVAGIAIFVTVAAFVAQETPINTTQLVIIMVIMGVVILLLALAFAFFRKRFTAIFYIISAGVLYGFVATLAKVVINRVITGNFEGLTVFAIVALLAAVIVGAYFVQTAYSVGSPDLVIAGLTVVDPLIAVAIGIIVLREAADAPLWVLPVWLVAAGIAVYGVFQLAKTRAAQLAATQAEAAKNGHS